MSTDKLTREQKLAAITVLEEKSRRKKNNRPGYEPHAEQLRVHISSARERFVFCGNGWGKTTFLIHEVIWAARGYNPVTRSFTKVPANIVVVLDAPEKVAKKIDVESRKWFDMSDMEPHKDGKPHVCRWTFRNGSTVNFMFFDQDQQKFEGIDGIDLIAGDEPFPKYIYTGLLRGTREKGSDPKILVVGTPLAAAWFRTDIYEPWSRGLLKDVECFRGNSHANKSNLRDGFLEHFEARLSEQERAIRIEGQFFDLSGLALAHLWKRATHLVAPFAVPPEWPCIIVVDPHPRKPHAALLLTCSPDSQIYAVDEMSSRAVPSKYALELSDRWAEYNVVDLVSDSLGSSELTGGMGNLSFIQVLNQTWRDEELDWRIRPTTFKEKEDEAWISMIQEVLAVPLEPDQLGNREPRLKVFDRCKALVFDIENAEWLRARHSEDLKPKINITNRDFLSCLKYGLAAQPTYNLSGRRRVVKSRPSPWSGSAGSHLERRRKSELRGKFYDDDGEF